ncbi:MAG: extracellular solute-binding protein [Oscillospiraceae bacterium]|nr:extracellular solute-binding protein [Oscillospiraceae bacterium]
MKKTATRIMAAALSAVMVLAFIAGCKGGGEDDPYEIPEYVYVAESIALPADIGDDIRELVYSDGKIYFATYAHSFDEQTEMYGYAAKIFSMNIDGTGFTELENYKSPLDVPENASGGFFVNGMRGDGDGNLWVYENWSYYRYSTPEEPTSREEYYDSYEDLGSGNGLRKLDSTGAELSRLNTDSLRGDSEWFDIYSFNIDAAGNIYISSYDYMSGSQTIYALDPDGVLSHRFQLENWVNQLIRLNDGFVGFLSQTVGDDGTWKNVLQKIDYEAKELVELLNVPQNMYNIYPGAGSFEILTDDSLSLYGLDPQTGEMVRILNWIDSDIDSYPQNIVMLSDDKILCTSNSYNNLTYESNQEFLILTKTPYSELPEREIITLATLWGGNVRRFVVEFNKTNTQYRIFVTDYSQYNDYESEDGWNAGLTKLSTEIISGKVPDILDVSSLPYKQYVSRGLLEDLYKFIDSDPDFSRDSFVPGVFKAAEIDGGLYQIFSSFGINTLIGHPSVVGPELGWTMDEFRAVLAANPNADMPLGMWLTKDSFLSTAVALSIDEYIDWTAGTTNFNSQDFIHLLEFANTFPTEFDYNALSPRTVVVGEGSGVITSDIAVGPGDIMSEDQLIATGRQIMAQIGLYDFWSYTYYRSLFGGQLAFKGFPTENRNGHSLNVNTALSITAGAKNKEGAWEFVRTSLEKDWQLAYSWGFMTNKEAFDYMVEDHMKREAEEILWRAQYGYEASYQQTPLTYDDVNRIFDLLGASSGTAGWNTDESLLNIIRENASDYFNGQISAADAARLIQSRAQILVSERS